MADATQAEMVKSIIGHADRYWQAEVVNAERYERRIRFLVPTIFGLIGFMILGLIGGWKPVVHAPPLLLVLASGSLGAMVTASVFLFLASWALLFKRGPEPTVQFVETDDGSIELRFEEDPEPEGRRSASYELEPADDWFDTLDASLHEPYAEIAYRTFTAAKQLQARNAMERARIRSAERYAARGSAAAAFSVILFLLGVRFPMMWMEVNADERGREKAGDQTGVEGARPQGQDRQAGVAAHPGAEREDPGGGPEGPEFEAGAGWHLRYRR